MATPARPASFSDPQISQKKEKEDSSSSKDVKSPRPKSKSVLSPRPGSSLALGKDEADRLLKALRKIETVSPRSTPSTEESPSVTRSWKLRQEELQEKSVPLSPKASSDEKAVRVKALIEKATAYNAEKK